MAADFLTQLAQISFDPGLTEVGYTEHVGITVYDITYGVNKFNPVTNPGFFGAFQPEVNRIGASWVEMGFTGELRGFKAYSTSPSTLYDPPPEGRLLTAMGFNRASAVQSPSPIFAYILGDMHLATDTVHTSGVLAPLDLMLDVDSYYRGMKDGVGTAILTFDAEAGPPTLACTFRGGFYEDETSPTPVVYKYPQTDIPADWTSTIPKYRGKVAQTCLNEGLTLQVIPNDGTYTPVTIAGVELRSLAYDIGNIIAPTPNVGATYGFSQTLLGKRIPDILLKIRTLDPGTKAAPSTFNIEKIADDASLLSLSLTHGSGDQNAIATAFDAYISDIIDYEEDSNGLFVATLKCQQALKDPNGTTDSQALQITFT